MYRVWDKETKTMYNHIAGYNELGYDNCPNEPALLLYNKKDEIKAAYIKDVILLQDTGFKDINNIEIYNGDILHKDFCWPVFIEYYKGGFRVRDIDKIRYVNLIIDANIDKFDLSGWKVVGNIYENPELREEI